LKQRKVSAQIQSKKIAVPNDAPELKNLNAETEGLRNRFKNIQNLEDSLRDTLNEGQCSFTESHQNETGEVELNPEEAKTNETEIWGSIPAVPSPTNPQETNTSAE